MELGVDRAVDDPGLEAGVRIAEQYRGSHGIVAAVYASVVVSAAKRQLDLSLAVLGSCMAEMQGCRLEAGAKHEPDRPARPAAGSYWCLGSRPHSHPKCSPLMLP